MSLSLAQQVAQLPDDEREAVLADLDQEELLWDWSFWRRPEQAPPDDDSWHITAAVAGRGFGKTRAGAEWIRKQARENPGCRIALVGRTAADVRDVMIEGPGSGILEVSPPSEMPEYKPSIRRVVWPNGSQATTFSAEEPNQMRGPQFHYTWADEVAAWKFTEDDSGVNAWGQVVLATRLGDAPQIFATTTPKRTPFMFDLLERADDPAKRTLILRGSTLDNAGNLSQNYLDFVTEMYEGTRLAEQELYGQMLLELEGALWTEESIARARLNAIPGQMRYRVIGVDPSVAEQPKDECGIVVVGATGTRHLQHREAFVLEDASIHGSPTVWAQQVVDTWRKWKCPVVAERNQGGELVRNAIHQIEPAVPVIPVWSKQGKQLRAEPVTLRYDKGKVHHIGYMPELEAQMTTWEPDVSKKSPDRVDALVHAITALLVKPSGSMTGGPLRAKSAAGRKLPGVSGGKIAGSRRR